MTIASMTGFARTEGQAEGCAWTWEAKSVNGRGLELRCRLPVGFETLEPAARQRAAAALKRGSVSLTLNVSWTVGQQAVRINEDVLDRLLALTPTIGDRISDLRPSSAAELLALRGVIDVLDPTPTGEARTALEGTLLDGLDRTLAALVVVRRKEGERLVPALRIHLDRIGDLCEHAAGIASAQPAAILARLQEQVAALLDQVPALPAERMAQEAVLLATRADSREETDRIRAHHQAALALLGTDVPIGRQLDFLCQELNREANTLCSKSSDIELTRVGLDLKATIEQFREQVQNIE